MKNLSYSKEYLNNKIWNRYSEGSDHQGNNQSGNDGSNGNGDNNGNNNGNRGPERPNPMVFIIVAAITLLAISYFLRATRGETSEEISYNEFVEMAEMGTISKVTIAGDRLLIEPVTLEGSQSSSKTYYTGIAENLTEITGRLLEHDITVQSEVEDGSSILISFLLTYVVPVILMWILLSFLFRKMTKGGGMGFGVGRSNAKVYGEKETGVTFVDVAGEDEAKESLVEVVDFLHNPEKYSKIGAKLPKGALLVGPPGTGKTLLAKAVAGEAKVPFFSLAGSDFVELYVGVGASRVRDLFKEAEKNAPCIIFIDEIDAIGRSRDSKYGGGNEEREQTLNQLLSEMDGFDGKKGIIILAATNRPEILDKALLRPGRFDRRIIVEEPDLKGRVEILKVHAKNVNMDETVDLDAIALATVGAVGSDLANMINEAAILAVKNKREYVNQQDLLNAVELVSMGKEKKDRILSAKERKIVSYHEVGHALISALQKNSEPVQKITIVPRTMGTLGYVLSYPEEEKFTQTEKELRAELVSLFGGRAAESIVFDTVTTGASNDIEKATKIARAMVTRFGMSKRFGLIGLETVESQYLDHRASLNCADETAAAIDEEVMKILKESYKEAKKLLKENRQVMDKIADYLIEKETITGHEFMEIFCREKGIPMPKKDKGEESLKKLRKDREASEGNTQTAAENIQNGSESGSDIFNRNFSILGAGISSLQSGGLPQMPVNTGDTENQQTIGTKIDIAVGDNTDSICQPQTKSAVEDTENGDSSETGSSDAEEPVDKGSENMSELEKKYASMLKNRQFQPSDDKLSDDKTSDDKKSS
ncbi:MAG: ATP-dependent zinc metalloprotease FtsH [Lachnospiraceae bacterium]|nr:ATP-dependent zinc metalloprotease FtsH [Lachnospiraceae bacterium]